MVKLLALYLKHARINLHLTRYILRQFRTVSKVCWLFRTVAKVCTNLKNEIDIACIQRVVFLVYIS